MTACRTAFVAAVFGLASLAGPASHATVITFYDLAVLEANVGPTTVVEDYESLNFGFIGNFTSTAGLDHVNLGASSDGDLFIGDPSLFDGGVAPSKFLTANGNEFFRVTLPTPTHVLGMDTYVNGMGPITVSFLDGADGILGTTSFGTFDAVVVAGFLGAVSSTPIAAFEWHATFGQVIDTGVDNIRTGNLAASVPAPAPAGLLACAVMLGLVRQLRGQSPSRL